MATKKIERPTSGTYSAGQGKFKFIVSAAFSTSAITLTYAVQVTDALKESHTAKFTCDGTTKTKKFKKKGRHVIGTLQIKSQTVPKITMSYAGKKATINSGTIVNTAVDPATPSRIGVTKDNDAQYTIIVEGTGYTSVPTHRLEIQRCKDVYDTTNGFSDVPCSTASGYFDVETSTGEYIITAVDSSTDIERGHRYWFRARAVNIVGSETLYSAWVYSSAADEGDYTTANNDALTGSVAATRIANNNVTVSWEISNVSYINNGLVTSFDVYRSTDDGPAVLVDNVLADINYTQYSYSDTGTTAGHKYKWLIKVRGEGDVAESFSASSEDIYMSPTAPQEISAAYDSSGDVVVSIVNTSKVATQLCIERSIDGGAWTQVYEEEYIEGGQAYTDESAVGTTSIEYRARNKCDQLTGTDMYSGYVTSSPVVEKSAPYAPTLKTPVSGSAIMLDTGAVRLVFQHNATDGSAQEAAQLRYKLNSESYTTVTLTTESYYSIDISGYSAQDVVTWQVRTKGAHDDYSEWSAEATFRILTKPELSFTSPNNGSTIETLPVTLAWDYSDLSGTLQSLKVNIKKKGVIQKTFEVPVGDGTSGSYSYSLAGFLLENDTVYSIEAIAQSSSGFAATADIAVTISYEEVELDGGLIPTITFDEDAIATIIIERDLTPAEGSSQAPEAVSIENAYLYRLHDGERTLVASGLEEGTQVMDRHAPINVSYEYELLMLTEYGTVAIVTVEAYQTSPEWMVYWGEDGIARAKWNPQGSASLERPEKTQVRYSGRKYPVTYDSDAMAESYQFQAVLFDREELNNFKQMMRDGGHGIWKSGDGDVYDADFKFEWSSDFKARRQWNCTLTVTRVNGD